MVDTRPNEITGDLIEPHIRKIESFLKDLESEKGTYLNRCKSFRVAISDAISDASDAGVPKAALKKAIETLKLQRRINKLRSGLEEDMQAFHDQIITAVEGLEDLPLGIAAVEREKREAGERRRRKGAVDKLGEGNGEQADTTH